MSGAPVFGQWTDPEVEAELKRPRTRGRPPNRDKAAWEASLRLYPGTRRRPNTPSINAEIIEGQAAEIACTRREILAVHRTDRRDEARLERLERIRPFVESHPTKSATWIAARLAAGHLVSTRTLRNDVAILRKAGNATHAAKSK